MSIIPKNLYKASNGTESAAVEITDPLPILQPAGLTNDTYHQITDKIWFTYKHIYHYYNDYDWYFKADDNTFAIIDNLRSFLSTKDPNHMLSYGYNFRANNGYQSGGAGVVFGIRAMQAIGKKLSGKNDDNCRNSGPGNSDVDLSKCLKSVRVRMGDSLDDLGRERFHVFDAMDSVKQKYPDWFYSYAQNQMSLVSSVRTTLRVLSYVSFSIIRTAAVVAMRRFHSIS